MSRILLRHRFCLITAIWLAMLCPVLSSGQTAENRPQPAQARAKALYAEGMSALRKQDLAAAQAAFEKLIRVAPKSPEAHNSLGWVLLNQGQVDPAVAQFRSAIRLKPDFPQAHLNLANALSQRRDFAEAESEAHEAVRLAPKDSETHRQLGHVLSFRGDSSNAI